MMRRRRRRRAVANRLPRPRRLRRNVGRLFVISIRIRFIQIYLVLFLSTGWIDENRTTWSPVLCLTFDFGAIFVINVLSRKARVDGRSVLYSVVLFYTRKLQITETAINSLFIVSWNARKQIFRRLHGWLDELSCSGRLCAAECWASGWGTRCAHF